MLKRKALLWVWMGFACIGAGLALNSHAADPKPDVGIEGPGGKDFLIYFKDGNKIVVRHCEGEYPKVEKRSDCVGKENRVPIAAFKQALKSQITIEKADYLKPLTKAEIAAYRKGSEADLEKLQKREKDLDALLTRIAERIKNGDCAGDEQCVKDQDTAQTDLKKVREELSAGRRQDAAIKKINGLIDKLVDNEIAATTLKKYTFGKAKDELTYTVLKNFDPNTKFPCGGLNPNCAECRAKQIAEGMVACEETKTTSSGNVWELVTRTESGHEVWKDRTSGLTWSDRLDKRYTHYEAVEMDDKGNVVKEKACVSSESLDARGKISNLSWSLPKIGDYEAAEKHGIREVLPNMNHWFWSASLSPYYSRSARLFYGVNGDVGGCYRDYYYISVRCVGR